MLKLLLALVIGYAAVVAFVYFNQHRMLYLPDVPTRELAGTPADVGLPFREVTLETGDGVTLHGWFVPAAGPRVLLFLHGNAGNVSHRLQSIQVFNELGLSVLIVDYRGYGRSSGTPSEAGTYEDAQTSWNHLVRTQGHAPGEIIVFGRSLGGP